MKTNVLLCAFVCTMLGLSSCDNDDNYVPEDVVVKAFNSKYPEAARVEWETKAGYKVADFYLGNYDTEAWFDTQGNWIYTETDIVYNDLPDVVKNSFSAGEYASWRVDDVDKLERPNTETVYIIEVEQGKQEFDLYYSEDGTLVKVVTDGANNTYEPGTVSSALIDKVAQMYPGAKIYDFDREGTYFEIDILDGKTHKSVVFDSNNEWVYTEWDIRTSDVPAVVMTAFNNSEYKGYHIDDVEVHEKPDGLYYQFELEPGDDFYVTFAADGTLVK